MITQTTMERIPTPRTPGRTRNFGETMELSVSAAVLGWSLH